MAATQRWNLEPDNTIVVLDGGSLDSLWGYHWKANPDWYPTWDLVEFLEPDLDDELTGFAIKPGHAPKWISSLRLVGGGENK